MDLLYPPRCRRSSYRTHLSSPSRLGSTLFALVTLFPATLAVPFHVPFAKETFGPDGPWQAVEVKVGTPPQTIHLYPGNFWGSQLLSTSICSSTDSCPSKGNQYDLLKSTSRNASFDDYVSNNNQERVMRMGDLYMNRKMLDTLSMKDTDGEAFVWDDAIFELAESAVTNTPGTLRYGVTLGHLSLGGHAANGGITVGDFRAGLTAAELKFKKRTRSNSFGLHIGSAFFSQPGSLVYGGYDRSRVAGPPSAYRRTNPALGAPVKWVQMKKMGSGITREQDQVLALAYKAVREPPFTRRFDPTVPYLYLPGGACEKLAERMPVVYNAELGLYLFNTSSEHYESFLKSTDYIEFGFAISNDDLSPTNPIRVPLALLHLVLKDPIVEKPTAYFPCRHNNNFVLGRAFLQAAYIGRNWERNMFFLAQAPGPGDDPSKEEPELVDIEPSMEKIDNREDYDFDKSWKKTFEDIKNGVIYERVKRELDLPAPGTPWDPTPNLPGDDDSKNDNSDDNSLSPAAIAGLVVGTIGILAALAVLIWFLLRRRRKNLERLNSPSASAFLYHRDPTKKPLSVNAELPSPRGALPLQHRQEKPAHSDHYDGPPPFSAGLTPADGMSGYIPGLGPNRHLSELPDSHADTRLTEWDSGTYTTTAGGALRQVQEMESPLAELSGVPAVSALEREKKLEEDSPMNSPLTVYPQRGDSEEGGNTLTSLPPVAPLVVRKPVRRPVIFQEVRMPSQGSARERLEAVQAGLRAGGNGSGSFLSETTVRSEEEERMGMTGMTGGSRSEYSQTESSMDSASPFGRGDRR